MIALLLGHQEWYKMNFVVKNFQMVKNDFAV